MKLAALYDIHGNLPALEAVLEEVRGAEVDRILVGGDVVPGPMPREALERMLSLEVPVQFIRGNGELAVLAQMAAPEAGAAEYWGTVSGKPLPEPLQLGMRWSAEQLGPSYQPLLASWPRTQRIEIPGLGAVLFCHATPRSETEVFTRATSDELLRPLFDGLGASVVVVGHTHMQFFRTVGSVQLINAGSVGMPIGASGAFWALLGPGEIQLHRTTYDVAATAERVRATAYPQAEDFAGDLLHPPDDEKMIALYQSFELNAGSDSAMDQAPHGGR